MAIDADRQNSIASCNIFIVDLLCWKRNIVVTRMSKKIKRDRVFPKNSVSHGELGDIVPSHSSTDYSFQSVLEISTPIRLVDVFKGYKTALLFVRIVLIVADEVQLRKRAIRRLNHEHSFF